MRDRVQALVEHTRDAICDAILARDGVPCREDVWDREGGGGGVTRVFQDGTIFEKAGVNVSTVHGTLGPEAARALGGDPALAERAHDFWATGVSVVIHPVNPHVPIVHANYRYFERLERGERVTWWFGGGADLTPCYLHDEDARHFHTVLRRACDAHDPGYYPRFKKGCDEYFRIPHRGESRGVGGIFFDHLRDPAPEAVCAFVESCANAFVPAYFPIVDRRLGAAYGERERRWQAVRRGRYVEFNLVYDRGTVFGLKTAGRIESVLMSLPPRARWVYGCEPEPGSEEARLVEVLERPIEWV